MSAHLLQDDVIRPYHPHALGRSNAVLECIHVGIYIRDRVLLFVIFDEVVNLCDICGLFAIIVCGCCVMYFPHDHVVIRERVPPIGGGGDLIAKTVVGPTLKEIEFVRDWKRFIFFKYS